MRNFAIANIKNNTAMHNTYISKALLAFALCAVPVAVVAETAEATTVAAKEKAPVVRVDEVHPLNWWTDMKNPEVQVLLHGLNISQSEVSLSTADVRLSRIERLENPNYLILYLDTKGAQPQSFNITLTNGKKKLNVPYELCARTQKWEGSFDASDVLYLLMPDRFANGDTTNDNGMGLKDQKLTRNEPFGRHGGDLAGISQHLDYLQDLGITAIWPTPIQANNMQNGSYHGYAITNYYEVDPRFGTNDQFRQLVADCKAHGIKFIMDLVFNHCGSENFLFRDLPARDWFNNDSEYLQTNYKLGALVDPHTNDADYNLAVNGWFTKEMPDLNQKNPLVMDYLIQASIWWTEYAGISGIRQDTYPYCDVASMARWNKRMELEYPGYNIVGETWINYNVGVAPWQKDSKLADINTELKTVMDFPLMYLLDSIFDEETDDWNNGFARLWDYFVQDKVYADPLHLLTFLDNHDTDRFCPTAEKAANFDRYRQALTVLLFARGIPQLYYGDEIGLWSNKSKGDGLLRQDFPGGWADDERNAFTREGRTTAENERYDFTRRLLQFRKGNKAISEGDMMQFTVKDGCYCFARHLGNHWVTIVMNGTSQSQTTDLNRFREALPKDEAFDVLKDQNIILFGPGLTGKYTLPARGILILDFK